MDQISQREPSRGPEMSLLATSVRRPASASWDSFADQCDAGYRGSLANIRAWHAKRYLNARVRYFRLRLTDGPVVGQCAVGVGRSGGVFLDRIMLLPDFRSHWQSAMRGILEQLPPGDYIYGWEQSLEADRSEELARIPGVAVVSHRPLIVGAVDFSRWDSWDAYYRAISTNIRRNVQKAQKQFPEYRLDRREGLRSLVEARALVNARSDMYRRKGIHFDRTSGTLKTILHLTANRERVFVATVRSEDKVLSAFNGLRFGDITYYLDGGSTGESQGASWLLLVEMLRDAYQRHPNGYFIMGYADMATHDETRSGGLLRMRRSCRVTEVATGIVNFDWKGH